MVVNETGGQRAHAITRAQQMSSASRHEAQGEQAHEFLNRLVLAVNRQASAIELDWPAQAPFELARRHNAAFAPKAEDAAIAFARQFKLVIEPGVDARLRYAAIQFHVAHS